MVCWWRGRKAERQRVVRQADQLIARHREKAYEIARRHRIQTLDRPTEHGFWCAVARVIADRTGREIGVDAATRYLEQDPTPQNWAERPVEG